MKRRLNDESKVIAVGDFGDLASKILVHHKVCKL